MINCSASDHSLVMAVPRSFLLLVCSMPFLAGACGSGSTTGVGGADGGDAGTTSTPSTCAEIADAICARGATCAGDGKANIQIGPPAHIAYESRAFCTKTFTEQCGPATPESYVPRVADPAACGTAIGGFTCAGPAYALPVACGGR